MTSFHRHIHALQPLRVTTARILQRTKLNCLHDPIPLFFQRNLASTTETAPTNFHQGGKVLRVLGIETSCDDTAVAIVSSTREILAERIRHQVEIHEPMGGIVPAFAAVSHVTHLPALMRGVLDDAGLEIEDLDAVAVTRGPGLAPCLKVGCVAASTLASVLRKPLIGVHHMEAHALTARFTTPTPPTFPFLAFLISGGHTLLLLAHDVGQYTTLATSRDDNVGEAFDKIARLLRIPWMKNVGGGAGAALELVAKNGNPDKFRFVTPMLKCETRNSMEFSFTGLKTSVKSTLERSPQVDLEDPNVVADVAASFQKTVTAHLTQKLGLVIEKCKMENIPIRHLVVSGGVASNQYIRERLSSMARDHGLEPIYPPVRLCTDNGVMIAWAGMERFMRGKTDEPGFDFIPKWSLDTMNERIQPEEKKVVEQASKIDKIE